VGAPRYADAVHPDSSTGRTLEVGESVGCGQFRTRDVRDGNGGPLEIRGAWTYCEGAPCPKITFRNQSLYRALRIFDDAVRAVYAAMAAERVARSQPVLPEIEALPIAP
jgi:hypothetical protein